MVNECISAGFSFAIGKFFAGIAIFFGIIAFCAVGGFIWLIWPRGSNNGQ